MKPYIKFFDRNLPIYGICMSLGFLIAGITAILRRKRFALDGYEITYAGVFVFLGGIVGAKLLAIITFTPYLIQNGLPFYTVLLSGFVFYGGFIGGFVALIIYTKVTKQKLMPFVSNFAVSIPLGHAIGRIGCFFGGCCYGIEFDSVISVIYTQSADISTPLNIPLLPIQLIESGCLLVLYACLEIFTRFSKNKELSPFIYAFAYGIIRITLECFRGDAERGLLLGISTSQIISSIMIVVALYFIMKRSLENKYLKRGNINDKAD